MPSKESRLPSGFTLVELLVVISIIAVLIGLLMPIMGVANRSAAKTNTMSIMKKADAALRMFHQDVGTMPYMGEDVLIDGDADLVTNRRNRLWRRLGTPMNSTIAENLQADLNAIDAVFSYNAEDTSNPTGDPEEPAGLHALAFKVSDLMPGPAIRNLVNGRYEASGSNTYFNPSGNDAISHAAMLNKMANERYRLAILAGNPGIVGWRSETVHDPANRWPTLLTANKKTGRDNSGSPVLTSPSTVSDPGWREDYLAGQIEKRFIDSDAIDLLDNYSTPIVYMAPVVSGVRSTNSWILHASSGAAYGISDEVYGLAAEGRRSRSDLYRRHPTKTSYVTPTDPSSSDRRFWTEPGRELDTELWSAGPDGILTGRRNHPRNTDNISLFSYDRYLTND